MKDTWEQPLGCKQFLLARIAEDQAQTEEVIRRQRRKLTVRDVSLGWVRAFDPKRVYEDCEAKLKIIAHETRGRRMDLEAPHVSMGRDFDGETYIKLLTGEQLEGDEAADYIEKWSVPITDTPILRMLAMPYADHPDFDPAWRLLTPM